MNIFSNTIVYHLIFLGILLILSAFFSGSETALFSLTDIQLERLRKKSAPASRIIFYLLKYPEKLIITILIGNELVNLVASVAITAIAIKLFDDKGKYLAVLLSAAALLIFGEITPKTFAVKFPETWSMIAAKPLNFIYNILSPVRLVLNRLVNILKGDNEDIYKKSQITEEEFKTLIRLGKNEGELEKEESEMIQNVFELEELSVLKVMTPRTDMFCINIDTDLKNILIKLKEYRFSRIPIYKGKIDNIAGILYAKELLHHVKQENNNFDLKNILHAPLLVPGTKKLDELLSEFRKKKIHMAIVIDEYGGVEGLVTMEDLLEELFGEMAEGFDIENKPVHKLSDSTYRISAMLSIDELNKLLNTKISEEGFDTLGGYVLHLFGKVPKKGEFIRFDGITFTVEKMKGARIMEVKVTIRNNHC